MMIKVMLREPIAAIDRLEQVTCAFSNTDGQFSQSTVSDDDSPIRNQIIGLID